MTRTIISHSLHEGIDLKQLIYFNKRLDLNLEETIARNEINRLILPVQSCGEGIRLLRNASEYQITLSE